MDTTRPSLLMRVRNVEDAEAWRQFDGICRPMLYRFGRSSGLSDADAEDVTQHCMSAINRHIRSFDYDPRKGRFKGWLRTMVNNRIRNLVRGRREQPAESQDFKRPQQREQTPEELFDEIWMDEHLKHCMKLVQAQVEPTTFEAFQRYVLDEQPVERVCQELGLTANQLYKIKWRVTQKLTEKMQELLEGCE